LSETENRCSQREGTQSNGVFVRGKTGKKKLKQKFGSDLKLIKGRRNWKKT